MSNKVTHIKPVVTTESEAQGIVASLAAQYNATQDSVRDALVVTAGKQALLETTSTLFITKQPRGLKPLDITDSNAVAERWAKKQARALEAFNKAHGIK